MIQRSKYSKQNHIQKAQQLEMTLRGNIKYVLVMNSGAALRSSKCILLQAGLENEIEHANKGLFRDTNDEVSIKDCNRPPRL